jgi:hypothetical protein
VDGEGTPTTNKAFNERALLKTSGGSQMKAFKTFLFAGATSYVALDVPGTIQGILGRCRTQLRRTKMQLAKNPAVFRFDRI